MRAPRRWPGPECRGADRLALAVTAYVNGPAFKKGLPKRHEDFAVTFAKDLEGPLATAAGSVRGEIRVKGRCSRDPHALHQGKTRPVDEGKALVREARVNRRSNLTPYRRPILTPSSGGFWR
ncbi:hypothetical protein ACVWZ6_008110 [Bradyrhizobium sp. GM6.1]